MAKTTTKRDIVLKITHETGLRQLEVKEVVQRTLDTIIESLAAGNKVELRNFGVFEPVRRRARIGRNPNDPTVTVHIPEKWVADFTPGRLMKARIEKLPL